MIGIFSKYLILVSFPILFACKAKQIKEQADNGITQETAFYFFKVNYDSVAKKSMFRLEKVQISKAEFKPQNMQNPTGLPDYVNLIVKDETRHTIQTYYEHPLFRKVDAYEENGAIEAKQLILEESEWVVRLPHYSKYKTIEIEELRNNKKISKTIIK
jgi:hypothetical protein